MPKSIKNFKIIILLLGLTGLSKNMVYAQYSLNKLDLAPAGTITGGTNFGTKGAIGRDFYSFTSLALNESFTVDIGTSLPVADLTFGTWFAGDVRFIPAGYNIDYSDDNVNWTNLVAVTSNSNLTITHTANVWARYWRLKVTNCQPGQNTCSISGFQIISNGLGSAVSNNFWNTPWVGTNIFTYSPVIVGATYMPAGYQFAVNGNAIATSVTVKSDIWSDYVFKKKYNLMPLEDVKKYIHTNSHLPDLPAEKEVIEKGLNLGQINNLLTKKVEELTLYLIEMHQNQKQQEKVNRQLLKRIIQMEANTKKHLYNN